MDEDEAELESEDEDEDEEDEDDDEVQLSRDIVHVSQQRCDQLPTTTPICCSLRCRDVYAVICVSRCHSCFEQHTLLHVHALITGRG